MEPWEVIVVGSGPAGLMAAERAACRGRKTLLLEKNRKPGAKILLAGGTRCNLTHATDARGIVAALGPPGRFLYSALAALGPQQVLDLFAAEGVPTKVEPGGKVFPASDRAEDVLATLLRRLKQSGCPLALDEPLQEVERAADGLRLITARRTLLAAKVVLATGGKSYPATGTTGDGYRWAAALGHTIIPPRPALVPITTNADWVRALQGITVPDVVVKVLAWTFRSAAFRRLPAGPESEGAPACESPAEAGTTKRPPPAEAGTTKSVTPHPGPLPEGEGELLAEGRGDLLFTHFGLSGPVVLDVSRAVSGHPQPADLVLRCDLLPATNEAAFASLLQEACSAAGRRQIAAILAQWLPQRLAETLVEQAGIRPPGRAAELSKPERQALVHAVKRLDIPVAGTLGFRKAEVTAGGVALDEVDSRTMQSKIVPGLYFAGELLDLDGPIGGYNFQAAFSTGWLAGESV